jgi:hypothetical protein
MNKSGSKVVESMSALAARAVFEDATSVEAVAELFPAGTSLFSLFCCQEARRLGMPLTNVNAFTFSGFHANLGKLLCQVVAQNAPAWRREAASGANTISLPKLVRVPL